MGDDEQFKMIGGILTYTGVCCREWDMMVGAPPGRCGLCGEIPRPKEVNDAKSGSGDRG